MDNKQYMIFYRESDVEYYLFNGEWVLSISPGAKAFGNFTDSNTTDEILFNTNTYLPVLATIMGTTKRFFIVNKQRYRIVERSTFLSEP